MLPATLWHDAAAACSLLIFAGCEMEIDHRLEVEVSGIGTLRTYIVAG